MNQNQSNISGYIYIGITVFIIMFITGWVSGVSSGVLLVRSVIAAVLFSLVAWGIYTFILKEIIMPPQNTQEQEEQAETGEQQYKGTQLDIVLPAEESLTDKTLTLNPRQIDPQLNRIINEDPERVAMMIKRMGLEEE